MWGNGNHEYLSDYHLGDKNQGCMKPEIYLDGTLFFYTNVQQTATSWYNGCYGSLLPPASIGPLPDSPKTEVEMEMAVYPNPAHDMFTLRYGGWEPGARPELTILTTTGQVVWQQKIRSYQTEVSTRHWPRGIYLLQVHDAHHGLIARRIAIEK